MNSLNLFNLPMSIYISFIYGFTSGVFFIFVYVNFTPMKCLRPYHVEHTSSRPIPEVKQRRAELVLGWVTAWEYSVL